MNPFKTAFLALTFTAALLVMLGSCKNKTDGKASEAPKPDSLGFSPPANDPFIKNGEEKVRYPDGALQMQGSYVKNKKDGNWFSWYSDGKPWSETSFDNGVKNGPTKTWYENGKLRYTGQYKNDAQAGVWKYYLETGELGQEVDYDKKKSD